jgi:hypothetical protein
MPFDAAALRHALDRMRDFNQDRSGGILCVAEEEALKVARAGFTVFFKYDEYIFDRAAVMALEGSGFRRLRRERYGAQRVGQIETRPYRAQDEPACLTIVEAWKERLAAAGVKRIEGCRGVLACLAGADRFEYPLLSGLVVEIDGAECDGMQLCRHHRPPFPRACVSVALSVDGSLPRTPVF